MPKLRVHNFSISLDGYGAGPNQRLDKPFGDGPELHDWMIATRTFQQMLGEDGGTEGIDDEFTARGIEGIGATIMGRNMFGPIRGPWDDDYKWSGWWGENPPYHHPVFVLTHHPRPSLEMEGGTTFHFIDEGIETALDQAFQVSEEKDVRVGGGADTIQQYLRAGLIDDMHVAIVPVLMGGGERLFNDVSLDGYECVEFIPSPTVLHVRLSKTPEAAAKFPSA